jgi:O-antigen/teichoic acid export membrane protein
VACIIFEQGTLLVAALFCVQAPNLAAITKTPFKRVRTAFRANRSILLQTYALSSAKLLVGQMDMFLAGYYFVPEQVGHYRLAKNVVMRISVITAAIQAAVFPELLQLLAKSRQRAKSFILRLNAVSALVLLPLGGLLFVFAPQILRVLANGQDVTLPVCMIRIVIFPLLCYQISGIWLHPLLVHFRKINLMTYVTLASAALALVVFFCSRGLGIVSIIFVICTGFVASSVYLLLVAWFTMSRHAAV